MTTVIHLRPLDRGQYAVLLDGNVIVERTDCPELHAARQLLTRGIEGPCSTVGPDGIQRLRFDIARWLPAPTA